MKKLSESERLMMKGMVIPIINDTKECLLCSNERKIFFIGSKRELMSLIYGLIMEEVKNHMITKNDIEILIGSIMAELNLNTNNIFKNQDEYSEFINK